MPVVEACHKALKYLKKRTVNDMDNLMTATRYVKEEILKELRGGNTEVLIDLPPVMAMSYGMALQRETDDDIKDPSPIDEDAVNEAVLSRIADTGIREQIIKQMEQNRKEQ